jgi:hypothetical protein
MTGLPHKIGSNSLFPSRILFQHGTVYSRNEPLCKCKASKSPTLHTRHLSYRNESKVARSLGWVAVAGSGGDKGAFTFCVGNFLNSQIVKAEGRMELQGNLSCLAKEQCIPTLANFNKTAFIYINMQSDSCDLKDSI